MNESRTIQESIRKLAGLGDLRATNLFIGEVTSVNEDDRECDVTSILDGESITYEGVHLSPERNDGFLQIPSIESSVLCVKMPDGEKYVLSCSDIDKFICYIDIDNKFEFSSNGFIFNGGANDGMVLINQLVTRLNNIESELNTIITNINAWTPVANDGGAALKLNFSGNPAINITPTVKADIENTDIKQ